ncbi:MAG TPA: hypothetical protein ENN60_04180 [archaeon]|nr:hypothetical protein [archaeon]
MDLMKDLSEKTGKSEEEVWELIEAKRKEMEYLISEEGAAHIVASELGVGINKKVQVENLEPGKERVNINLRVVEVTDVREWKRGGRSGKVRNVKACDETGEIWISLWDERAEADLKEGDIIRILGGIVKATGGKREIRVGNKSNLIINPEMTGNGRKGLENPENCEIGPEGGFDAPPGSPVTVQACISRVIRRSPFFSSTDGDQLIITGMLDDGQQQIRGVFFREVVETLIGIRRDEAIRLAKEKGEGAVLDLVPVARDFWVVGKIKHNEMMDTKEIIVNRLFEINPGEKVDKKINELVLKQIE